MIEKFTRSTFSEQLNTTFRAHINESTIVDLEMVSATDILMTPKQEQFSIVFRGPLDARLWQGMYSLEHDRMGKFEIFLVPIRVDENGYYYEAFFNRLIG